MNIQKLYLPKVSILIPCYNAEKWIAQCIQSALDQTYGNKEVIVVDDGSTDKSWEMIQSFGDKIIAETGPNKGGNVARNRLLELSSGEWLQYLDADDYLLPDKIKNQMEVLDSKTDIIYSPSLMEYHHDDGTFTQEVLTIPEPHDPYILLARWHLPQTGSPLWKKQALLDIGGWKDDQPVCQEHELYLRLVTADKNFQYFSKAESVYRHWSEETLWKKNQSFTRQHRLIIENKLEKHLLGASKMTKERKWAINMARFETARSEWLEDKNKAKEIMKNVPKEFIPYGKAAPKLYRFMYFIFGFGVAEKIALLKRKYIKFGIF